MNIFYNPKRLLSYNSLFNFCLGARGVGKTFGFKDYCISNCIKKNRKFIYLRRYKTEIKSNKMKSFFNDINFKYENKLSCENNQFYYEKQHIGQAMSLSTYVSNKSIILNDYDYVIFDEFIIDKGTYHYLSREVETFLEFYNTIARLDSNGYMRDVKVFFLANSISSVNPYFAYWKINLPLSFTGIKRINEQLVLEINSNKAYTDKMKKTKFYKIIEGTQYSEYAFENKFLRDNEEFIEKKPTTAKYFFTLSYNGKDYGVFQDIAKTGNIYISEKYDKIFPVRFALTCEDMTVNTLFIKKFKNSSFLQTLTTAIDYGKIRYENQTIKSIIYEISMLLK